MNNMNSSISKRPLVNRVMTSWLILFSLLLGACSSKVTVVSHVPTPLVEKMPLNVHLSYTDEFKNYVYTETDKKRVLTSLDFAQAQTSMFDIIFAGLSTLVSANDAGKDITIEPEVDKFEYTTPRETSLKQYEVSIGYRLKLFNKDDSKLADWYIKGYGKTPTALLTSATQAFNSAVNVALRDIGAQLATQFSRQKEVRALIDRKSQARLIKTPPNENNSDAEQAKTNAVLVSENHTKGGNDE